MQNLPPTKQKSFVFNFNGLSLIVSETFLSQRFGAWVSWVYIKRQYFLVRSNATHKNSFLCSIKKFVRIHCDLLISSVDRTYTAIVDTCCIRSFIKAVIMCHRKNMMLPCAAVHTCMSYTIPYSRKGYL